MKRIIFCFDGSWNRLDTPHPTNVLFTAETVLPMTPDGTAQLIFYDEGVGTEEGEKWRGGLLGHGLSKNLSDGYRFLIFNYTPGDEIYIFGFSRGAYTARSFAGLLSTCGIISRRKAGASNEAIAFYHRRNDAVVFKNEALKFRAMNSPDVCVSTDEDTWRSGNIDGYNAGDAPLLKIQFLGVWDTVGALGIPENIFGASLANKKYKFHDVALSDIVKSARHAVAIDEQKRTFKPTLWDNLKVLNNNAGSKENQSDARYQQIWFPGVHGGVGGGGQRRGLSDQALDWVWDGARNMGLKLDTSNYSRVWELFPNYRENLNNTIENPEQSLIAKGMDYIMSLLPKSSRLPGPLNLSEVNISAKQRWKEDQENLPENMLYRPKTLSNNLDAELNKLEASELGVGSDPDVGKFDIYEVVAGDTLSKIAKKFYNNGSLFRVIFDANHSKISNPDDIYVGQALRIPRNHKA